MAAKIEQLTGNPIRVTVGTALNINVSPQQGAEGTPPTVNVAIGFSYAAHTYMVDEAGNKMKLLVANESPRYVSLLPEQCASFASRPITTADVGKTLFDLIADLWDPLIVADLASPNPSHI